MTFHYKIWKCWFTYCENLSEMGMKMICVGDHTEYIYNANGIDVNDLIEYCSKHKSIHGFMPNNVIQYDEFFEVKCDTNGSCSS